VRGQGQFIDDLAKATNNSDCNEEAPAKKQLAVKRAKATGEDGETEEEEDGALEEMVEEEGEDEDQAASARAKVLAQFRAKMRADALALAQELAQFRAKMRAKVRLVGIWDGVRL
jgi:hypothetical protein